jgi:hypothetical protein
MPLTKRPAVPGNTGISSNAISYIPRDPRYEIEIPVVLHLPDSSVKGHSINISESGIFAAFHREIEPWVKGRLSAQFGDWHVDFAVRVARIQGQMAGLAFLNLSDEDRAIIRKFLEQSNGAIS